MANTRVMEIVRKGFNGTITAEELEYYKANCMTESEKEIGKPAFQMSDEEFKQYQVLDYNKSEGNMTGYDCPLCRNKGNFAYIDKLGYTIYPDCQCVAIRNNLRRLEQSGLGNLINLYTFENYKVENDWQNTVIKKAYDFINSDGIAFLLLGQNGSGKSHICTAISKELMLKGMELRFMTWINDSTKLKQNKMNLEVYDKMISELQNIEVLYIDDLFKTLNAEDKPSQADINLAMEIINYRYNLTRTSKKRMITIISSEKTMSQLREYDEALAGRINELAGDWQLTLTGKDKNYRFNG